MERICKTHHATHAIVLAVFFFFTLNVCRDNFSKPVDEVTYELI